MTEAVLITLAASVLLGAVAQVLASLARMPSIVFLLALGVAFGPQGLGVIRPDTLGGGLRVLTACFVAVILFEGGLSLPPQVLQHAMMPVRRLITVGALVTWIGAAAACRYIGDTSWSIAGLYGSLVIVTGPTVVVPILRRVRLTARLAAIIRSEGILIDAVGAVAAVVMLEYVVAMGNHFAATLVGFIGRLALGGIIGGIAGVLAALVWRFDFFHKGDNQHLVLLGALGTALGAFAVAESLYSESGIMAATTAGLVLAATPIPFRHELQEFKETLTTLGVSVLFVLLSAGVDWRFVLAAGWRDLGVVAALMFVVRPLSVWISTWGTDLGIREKIYLSLLAPRGIVAAAMASHFTGELEQASFFGASRVESLVFLTIGVTVCLQGSWAGWLAHLLNVAPKRPMGVLLVGVNSWSLVLAAELKQRYIPVRFLDINPVHCERARNHGFDAAQADASDDETFESMDLSDISTLVAMTSNDAVNTLACDVANDWLGEDHVFQVSSRPVDGEPRAQVRLSGRWAMPSVRSHETICGLLRRDAMKIRAATCTGEEVVESEMRAPTRLLVPLLVISGDRVQIATEGDKCPADAIVLGLVEAEQTPYAKVDDAED